jgi:hypothetical protein
MLSVEMCHHFAKECLELAAETPNAAMRDTMLKMAEAWLELVRVGAVTESATSRKLSAFRARRGPDRPHI